jgi:hypothetical protein
LSGNYRITYSLKPQGPIQISPDVEFIINIEVEEGETPSMILSDVDTPEEAWIYLSKKRPDWNIKRVERLDFEPIQLKDESEKTGNNYDSSVNPEDAAG